MLTSIRWNGPQRRRPGVVPYTAPLLYYIYGDPLRFLHTRLLRYLPLIKSTNDLDSLGCGTQFQPCRQSRACFARGGLVFLAYAGVLFQPPLCLGPFPL